MPVTFEDIVALKQRSEENKKAPADQRGYLALELIADTLILTLEQELDEELADEEDEEEDEFEEEDEEEDEG
ncbi:MAG TPA: hypothetical protein VFX46_09155 [Hyphomicrobiaceae bacterium]|jgi:hypothetical protein|nr:MAG: hypothetical protein DIU57_00485 [Pseudomonadota bacterium]HEX5600792.1 hypothetical protein [Hyphomicrobiaceae bacterium]